MASNSLLKNQQTHQSGYMHETAYGLFSLLGSISGWMRAEKYTTLIISLGFLWELLFVYVIILHPVTHLHAALWSSKWDATDVIAGISLSVSAFLSTITYFTATWRWRGKPGFVAWLLIGFGAAFIFLNNFGYLYEYMAAYAPNYVPEDNISEYFGYLSLPFIMAGLLAIPTAAKRYKSLLDRSKLTLDVLLFIGAASSICWYYVFLPMYQAQVHRYHSVDVLNIIPSMIYGIVCLCFLYTVIIVIARTPKTGVYLGSLITLMLGTFWASLAEIGYVCFYYISSDRRIYNISDAMLNVAFIFLFISGAILCMRAKYAGKDTPLTMRTFRVPEKLRNQYVFMKAMLPSFIALATGIAIIISSAAINANEIPAAIALGVLTFLVALRQAVSIVENQSLLFLERHNNEQLLALHHEREKLIRQREEARANEVALRETNRRMDEFLNIASHELKTPLTGAKAHIQLAARRLHKAIGKFSAEMPAIETSLSTLQEPLSMADRQANRLARLINDLLDVSRIQTGHLDLRCSHCDLVELIKETAAEIHLVHPERKLIINFKKDLHIYINADPDRIEQVITNYLTNAMKYSPDDKPIEVSLKQDKKDIKVLVKDEGIGLTSAEQQRIWDRFYRVPEKNVANDTLQTSGEGLGLGLYISKSIIELHHGHVGIQSVYGRGSAFWFTLPLAHKPVEEETILPEVSAGSMVMTSGV